MRHRCRKTEQESLPFFGKLCAKLMEVRPGHRLAVLNLAEVPEIYSQPAARKSHDIPHTEVVSRLEHPVPHSIPNAASLSAKQRDTN